jgi:hypothetical protein
MFFHLPPLGGTWQDNLEFVDRHNYITVNRGKEAQK